MVISAMDRKLLRDLWHVRGQAFAISLVMACGVTIFVMAVNTLVSLKLTQQTYYERYRFADVFAHLKRAPDSLQARIAEIPGVSQVQTRVVEQVTLDVPDLAEPAVGRMVSIPDNGEPLLNDLYLRQGRQIESNHPDEVLISEGFAEAHKLLPGDTVTAILNGRKRDLRVVGVALSPEFVYQLRPGEVVPDDRRYGIFWMANRQLAAAFNMEGAFNDVCVSLMPGADEAEVIDRLDDLTEPYGGAGAYGRADQASHKFVSNEIEELKGMAQVAPTIFLAVAAFLLNVVMSRLINTQREQIAALKAFGYSNLEVGFHYFKFVLIVVTIGVAVGVFSGARFGRWMTEMYTRFFHFPVFIFRLDPAMLALSVLASLGAGIGATFNALRRAVRLPPAEAMRPEPPRSYEPSVLERLGLHRLLSPPGRMIVRHLERNAFKSALTCLGIGMAVSVLILGNFTLDSVTFVMDSQFRIAQRQDLSVLLVEKDDQSALHDIAHLPGVRNVEPFRAVSARIRAGHRARRVGVTGLENDADLFRLMDIHRRRVSLPPGGLVISKKLGEVLHVQAGDDVTLEVLEDERPVRTVPVVGLIEDFTGIAAYMQRDTLNDLMRQGNLISGAYLGVDQNRTNDLYAELKQTPRVASVTLKEATLKSFEDTVAENLLRMRLINLTFACIIAVGVVYNSVRISLSERGRELATLRVIGFTRAEISMILLGELAVLTALAIPIGLLMGYGLAWFVVTSSFNTELFRIPMIVSGRTYAFASAVVIAAAFLSGLIVRRRLDHLDLVAVLKSRE